MRSLLLRYTLWMPLEPEDVKHFKRATGWVELGNFDEANSELEEIKRGNIFPGPLPLMPPS